MYKPNCHPLALLLSLLLILCLVPAAHADGSTLQDLQNAIDSGTDFTLMGDLTIPADTTIYGIGNDNTGIAITVPAGKTLTVNGTLIADKLYDNGTVTVGASGFLYVQHDFSLGDTGKISLGGTLSVEHDAFDPSKLVWQENFFQEQGALLDVSFNVFTEEALRGYLSDGTPTWGSGFRRSFWMCAPWTLEANLTLPAETRLCIPYGRGYEGSLLIPAGKTLAVSPGSELYARGAGPASQEAVVEVRGALVNNGSIELDWGDTLADIALSGNGSLSGDGSVTRNGQAYDPAAEHAVWANLVAACGQSYNEYTEYDIEGNHVFTIRDSLTIPSNLSVFAIDSTFEVAFPGTFRIDDGGELIAGSLESFGQTTVNGSLHLENDLRILDNKVALNGDLVMTLDTWVNLLEFSNAEDPDDVAAKFSFGPDSLMDIWVEPAEGNVSAGLDYPMFHIPHIRETYCLTFPWTLDHNRTLQEDTRLLFHYGGEATGMLTVPEGMTLTVPEGSELFARGSRDGEAIVQVAGTLINNGRITLQDTRAGWADVALAGKGLYYGEGIVVRGDEAWPIVNNKTAADLILPEDLTDLQSQSLSDGDYMTIYIPDGVVTIANDAFGTKTGLIILAKPGSVPAEFAAAKGFILAPTA